MWNACSDTLPIPFTLVVRLDGRVVINQQVSFEGGAFETEFGY